MSTRESTADGGSPESGLLFEVQFHTRASFEAKQLTHAAYERLRNSLTPDIERDELQEFQRKVSAEIPIPPRVAGIEELLTGAAWWLIRSRTTQSLTITADQGRARGCPPAYQAR